MAVVRDNKHTGYHWTLADIGFAILMGVAVPLGIWLFGGLLIGLIML
ncbi:MAG: hypothetical protein JRF02_09815 [Deltaproteobacteria bacterium]|jgi:hypothetical protein|nr:hypothetical protein [Deltaproteobacteria bacterium]